MVVRAPRMDIVCSKLAPQEPSAAVPAGPKGGEGRSGPAAAAGLRPSPQVACSGECAGRRKLDADHGECPPEVRRCYPRFALSAWVE